MSTSLKFTDDGKVALLTLLRDSDLFLAWGTGDPTWDTDGTPEFAESATALLAELGRRKIVNKQWVNPTVAGDIIVDGNHYTLSVDPTQFLYISCTFDADEEPAAEIREYGVFVNPTLKYESPGQVYFNFTPQVVLKPGLLLLGQNFDKIIRSAITQENFYFVISPAALL